MAANKRPTPTQLGIVNPSLVQGATTLGGFALEHPTRRSLPILVAPSTEDQINRLREPLAPIACWSLGDVRFQFGSSFLQPEIAEETAQLARLIRRHKNGSTLPAMSIFGHSDPTGNDELNKTLSGRRAASVFGLLTRDVALWDSLFTTPVAEDAWGTDQVRTMLEVLGHEGPNAMADFQSARGLAPDGQAGPRTRPLLFRAYMDAVCLDPNQRAFSLAPADFLGGASNPSGKANYQGCGEFNPALLLSQSDVQTLLKPKRDELNTPNRRVVLFLFRPGTRPPTSSWPCPTVAEDTTGCRKRLFVDGAVRRTAGPAERKYKDTKDTFACRFYDRLARQSPCEGLLHERIVEIVFDDAFFGLRDGVSVDLAFADGSADRLKTDMQGAVFVKASRGPWVEATYSAERSIKQRRVFLDPPDPSTESGVWQRLVNMGYVRLSVQPDETPSSPEDLMRAIFEFQLRHRVPTTLALDAATASAVAKAHDEDQRPWPERGWFDPSGPFDPNAPEPKAKT